MRRDEVSVKLGVSACLETDRLSIELVELPENIKKICFVQWCSLESLQLLFMKQKCQIQMSAAQYKNASSLLRTNQHFQMRYTTLFKLRGLKSYQQSDSECVVFIVKQTLLFYFSQ